MTSCLSRYIDIISSVQMRILASLVLIHPRFLYSQNEVYSELVMPLLPFAFIFSSIDSQMHVYFQHNFTLSINTISTPFLPQSTSGSAGPAKTLTQPTLRDEAANSDPPSRATAT
jgi:hypothetical protein